MKNIVIFKPSKSEVLKFTKNEDGSDRWNFDPKNEILAARIGKKIVSMVEYVVVSSEYLEGEYTSYEGCDDVLVLNNAFTLPGYRKMGISNALIDAIFEDIFVCDVIGYDIVSMEGWKVVSHAKRKMMEKRSCRS